MTSKMAGVTVMDRRHSTVILKIINLFLILWISDEVLCQITPPPPINDSPIIANNRVYYLKTFPLRCGPPLIDTFPAGFVIKDSRAMMRNNSPHIIRGNIEIAPNGCLYIEPGSILQFAPGQGIIVNGTLIARGSELPGGRITMTKLEGLDLKRPSGDWQDDARLVMGNTTKDGRLDLKYMDRWRAICTNYNNFTAIDANVTCRHLGFLKGNFTYHSFARNLTDYILWEKPDCTGAENSLFDCPGASTIRTGRHICDGQEVIAFQCEGLRPGLALDHWRGIDFYNSTTEGRFQIQGNAQVYMNESLSFLEYLDISYTGLDGYHGRTSEPNIYYQKAAISASPYVPMMNNVTIRYGAYDALNFTEIIGPIHIANSTISNNRGYGMFIQSSVGRCLVNMTEVDHSWGDGIKFYLSNLTIFDFRQKFTPSKSFCVLPNTQDVTYPFYQHMDLVQVNGNEHVMTSIGGNCERTFSTAFGMRITVHFMIMERDPEATGQFSIKDGGTLGQELGPVTIYNGSFPQSITTRTNSLFIRFQYTQPQNRICKTFPPCIRFLLEFTTGYDVEEEFRLLMSSVHDNIGYGVNIQDMRSKVRISNETVISNNQFGAGVLVYKGAGDIIINGTRIEKNADAGVNITYSGGYQLINTTQFIANKGYGIITEYMKMNRTRIESQNKIEFVKTRFIWNELIGLRMGNYCSGGDILINESHFAYNYDEAIEYLSCNISTKYKTKFRVEFNTFNGNFRHAILMQPLLNTEGIITNNTFTSHSLSTIRIDNGYDLLISRWYRDFPVTFNMFENIFTNNLGRYVINIRLIQNSAVQNLFCKFNYFQKNEINNSFPFLNPRSRANAVIVLSSSNVQFRRNYVDNPGSVRELSTHLVDPSVTIDAMENYWGAEINSFSAYEKVYNSIFDQDDRYNLAIIKYYPALRTVRLYDNYLSDDVSPFVWQFRRGNFIGGILEDSFTVGQQETFYVDKDIYIFPDKKFSMGPGSTLKFMSSVGMVVHGVFQADGQRRETTLVFDLDDRIEFVPMENRTASVRLVNGFDEFEGRLEVEINGTWGTVCKDGWIEKNSLLVCQQLGLAYNPDYPTARFQIPASSDKPILMSWVSCDEVDTDLAQCRAVNEDARTCNHSKDVYIRCQKLAWAGITLAASYRTDQIQPDLSQPQIRFVQMNNTGLFDTDTGTMTPALRIDYNYYQISWLTIQNSMSDGILISYNQPYKLNTMEYITVLNSARNGIVTKSPTLEVMHSRFDYNQMAGFLYDPFFTEYDALLIRNMIYPTRRIDMFAQPQRILQPNQLMFLICTPESSIEKQEYIVEVKASSNLYKIVVQVLDYLPVESVEKVIIYDADRSLINSSTIRRWEIEKDLVDFPILSNSNVVTIQLRANRQLSGRLAFAVFPQPYTQTKPQLRTAVTNTTFNWNNQGIVTKHYNSPSNKRLELFHRHREEEITFKDVKIYNSIRHTMHMPSVTKFYEDYIPTYEDMTQPERVASINYTVFHCDFKDNAIGILAEHNHVDFANNVWKWTLNQVTIQGAKEGGLEIEVPRVNDESERKTHAVTVVESYFQNNLNFAFTIAGYYTEIKIDNNEFTNNNCRLGLISITGMEKNMTMNYNTIKDNVGRYMIDIDIISHSEYFTSVNGQMNLNDITNNRYEGQIPPGSDNSPKTYAVAVRGLQNIVANYNMFSNPSLNYELVAGITSILLGSSVNVTLNYWGYTDQPTIRKRIFDFDDWNNFAIADYFPYLSKADRNSTPSNGIREETFLSPDHLGGRVEKSLILMETGRPYIVQSDLTVMPGITFTIPPGTELQFRPDVGILVLGRLVANGLPFRRIKFLPVQPSNKQNYSGRKKRELMVSEREKRQITAPTVRLRGDGTLFKDAGFLELYNVSSKTWNMMCDSQLHEKTAEVVCRELGKEIINVKVRFTYLYDYYIYGKPMYSRKEFWYNSYFCRGDETSLNQCVTRYNYDLLNCVYAANYTFITCGARNLDPTLDYWGNIRFAMDAYEEQPLEADIGIDRSSLSYVDIVGAGMLHGEKVGAVQSTYVTPFFKNINISNCAENGYDIIAPRQDLDIQLQNISGNLGLGINILVLNGESSMQQSSFQPSGPSTMPYSVHGLVDICRLEKEIKVETRLILYYKYGPYTRDCVKIIRSRKTVGLRFLQINVFKEDFSRNSVEIYDGESANSDTQIGHIVANSSNNDIQQLYQTTGNVMAVHVHASASFGSYGFIAEVVKLPLSGLTYPNSDYSHTVQQSEIRKNEDGALQYKSVGETTPSLFVEHCWLGDNGFPILNLTSPPTIDISLQSTIRFRFSYNQVSYNHGGMYLFVYTGALNTALKGNMTNNIFAFGRNGEALNISGHYFQNLMLFQNYFYNYTAGDYRDIIHIKNVVVNLTHNYVLRNRGHYIIHTYNSDDGTNSQNFARNGIYDNNATALRESTIKIGQGRPKFINNFFVNPLNDFEMATYPRMTTNAQAIDAKGNWWGSEREAFINGKTYDYSDDNLLVEVDEWPPILDNRSLVEGNCPPGWVLDSNRCYRYMGGAVPYEQAKQFCLSHGAFLAESRNREEFFNYLMRLMVIEQDWTQRVWVMADVGSSRCAAFEKSYIVYEEDCGRRYYSFICETDPQVSAPSELTSAVKAMIIGISVGVGGVIIIIITIIVVLWCIKSKRREKERFERTASIRSSVSHMAKVNGSLRGTKSTVTVLSNGTSRPRLDDIDQRSVISSCDKTSEISTSIGTINRSEPDIRSRNRETQNLESSPPRRDNPRPVHSLRPDRTWAGNNKNSNTTRNTERYGGREIERQRDEESRRPTYSKDVVEDVGRTEQQDFLNKSCEDLDDKDSFISDSTFDNDDDDENNEGDLQGAGHDIDTSNTQYNVDRSNEQLFQKPVTPGKTGIDFLIRQHLDDEGDTIDSTYRNFTGPIQPPAKNIMFPARTTISNDLPTPPPDPRSIPFLQELNKQFKKPTVQPKPPLPAKKNVIGNQEYISSAVSESSGSQYSATFLVPNPQKKSINSPNHVYSNEQESQPQRSEFDPVLNGSPNHLYNNEHVPRPQNPVLFDQRLKGSSGHLYNNEREPQPNKPEFDPRLKVRSPVRDSDQGSSRSAVYDPVYNNESITNSHSFPPYNPMYADSPSDQSQSTPRYEPINYGLAGDNPYGVDQQPDDDYMPQPRNRDLSHNRKRLDVPSSVPLSKPTDFHDSVPSDSSFVPSIESDVDYIPRQYNLNLNNRFVNTLPQYPRENFSPHESVSSQDSRGSTSSRPPPYSPGLDFQTSRSHSSDRQNMNRGSSDQLHVDRQNMNRGSRDQLHEQPPPYSPDEELIPRRHGRSRDILYIPQGIRSRNQSYETEI